MSIKNFIDAKIKTTLDRKLFNDSYYNKSFIRSSFLSNKHLNVIDNYSDFFSIKDNNTEYVNHINKDNILGNSINSHLTQFCSVFNNFFKFKLQSFSFSGLDVNLIRKFNDNLNLLFIENRYKKMLILNPVKGGFFCYSLGFFGFLPKSHARVFFFFFMKKWARNKLLNISDKLFVIRLCIHKNFLEKTFIFRFPFILGKFIAYFQKIKKNFSKRKRKNRIFYNDMNFVFLAMSQEDLLKIKKEKREAKKKVAELNRKANTNLLSKKIFDNNSHSFDPFKKKKKKQKRNGGIKSKS